MHGKKGRKQTKGRTQTSEGQLEKSSERIWKPIGTKLGYEISAVNLFDHVHSSTLHKKVAIFLSEPILNRLNMV